VTFTGISRKVLVDQLRRLERFGLVARTASPSARHGGEYTLTTAGEAIQAALCAV